MSWRDDAIEEAYRLRGELDLGTDAIADVFRLMEEDLDVAVFRRPLGQGGADGLLIASEEITAALINSSCTLGRQRFTAAHELGHLRMDRGKKLWIDEDVGSPARTIPEKRANAFAAYFLMPPIGVGKALSKHMKDRLTPEVAVHLQRQFGTSYQSTLWHLLDLGHVNEKQRKGLASAPSERIAIQLGYGQQVACEQDERGVTTVPRDYAERAFGAFTKGVISTQRLAELLSMPVDELEAQLAV